MKMVLGDFNAKVGIQNIFKTAVGKTREYFRLIMIVLES